MNQDTKPIELISHHLCPYVQRANIVLTEKNIPHTRTYIDLANKPDWFVASSPIGKVPLLRIENVCLFESAVICEYLDEITPASLHPTAPLEKAYHRSWIEFASSILNTIAAFYNAPEHKAFEDSRTALVHKFHQLEDKLADGPYFGGKTFHLVDAAYGPVFRYLDVFEEIGNFDLLLGRRRTIAYRNALSERRSVTDAVTEDYSARLMEFLSNRPSHLASLV